MGKPVPHIVWFLIASRGRRAWYAGKKNAHGIMTLDKSGALVLPSRAAAQEIVRIYRKAQREPRAQGIAGIEPAPPSGEESCND